ncbi:hypothetical protein SAMN04488007_2830 [Maribacter aquivivus]|uniref:Uncharacterized protein n=1 Tax=Maribacter aquivivus TaxID=228958 RepID=A0A1M6RT15_9FLAO|nr:hypothetical protein [Maribacter aquivivus]SHK35427.1 hypothetical protein SAMN04488007_2830 [Maribacter aquivivus]
MNIKDISLTVSLLGLLILIAAVIIELTNASLNNGFLSPLGMGLCSVGLILYAVYEMKNNGKI